MIYIYIFILAVNYYLDRIHYHIRWHNDDICWGHLYTRKSMISITAGGVCDDGKIQSPIRYKYIGFSIPTPTYLMWYQPPLNVVRAGRSILLIYRTSHTIWSRRINDEWWMMNDEGEGIYNVIVKYNDDYGA